MSPIQQAILSSYATGTTVAGISQKALRSVPIRIPPHGEQVAIGELLGALDDEIYLNRRMNDILEQMARAIFRDWFVDFGPTRTKMEGGAPYLTPEIWSLFPDRLDDRAA
jgi:type I restriction enzyme, S subunit